MNKNCLKLSASVRTCDGSVLGAESGSDRDTLESPPASPRTSQHVPREQLLFEFASVDRAVEWGATLGKAIEEAKRAQGKAQKKQRGIKGFMRRATSVWNKNKGGAPKAKRGGKGAPVLVPDQLAANLRGEWRH